MTAHERQRQHRGGTALLLLSWRKPSAASRRRRRRRRRRGRWRCAAMPRSRTHASHAPHHPGNQVAPSRPTVDRAARVRWRAALRCRRARGGGGGGRARARACVCCVCACVCCVCVTHTLPLTWHCGAPKCVRNVSEICELI